MTVVDKTAPTQTGAITFEVDLRHPPQKVWRALTDPVLLAEWLLPAIGFKAERGASFKLQAPVLPQWDGVVDCRVLEVELHKRLSYSWAVGGMELDTVVTFTLEPTAEGTRLSIVQSGFKPAQKQNFGGARYGWRLMGTKLVDVLAKIE